jgi:hypothetical protein
MRAASINIENLVAALAAPGYLIHLFCGCRLDPVGLNLDEIGLVTIDGVQSGLEDRVRPDSRICFFPCVSGG